MGLVILAQMNYKRDKDYFGCRMAFFCPAAFYSQGI